MEVVCGEDYPGCAAAAVSHSSSKYIALDGTHQRRDYTYLTSFKLIAYRVIQFKATFDAPQDGPTQDRIDSIRLMEPPPVEIDIHLGDLFEFRSNGLKVWKRTSGATALTQKSYIMFLGSTTSSGCTCGLPPALVMTMST